MPTATVTSKGQITIPIEVRTALGLDTGDRVEFCETEEGQYTMIPRNGSIMEMRGCLAHGGPAISIEEMDQTVRDHAARLDRASMSDAPENRPDGESE